jgi:enediyne biosynthesis protein E4
MKKYQVPSTAPRRAAARPCSLDAPPLVLATALSLLGLLAAGCSSKDSPPAVDLGLPDALADALGDALKESGTSCKAATVTTASSDFFKDISESSGIRDENYVKNPTGTIPINDHSRLAFVDLDGDGYDDIVMHNLWPNPQKSVPFEHLVFHNNGDGTFKNVSDDSGLRDVQAAFFAFGDVDNDGDLDCFAGLDIPLTGYTHQLLLNDGKGHFTVKASSGIEGTSGQTIAGNAVFADFNADGRLDLFIGNGHTAYAGENQLFFGNGDGTFTDKSSNLSGNSSRQSNGSVACDYDNDGDLDIFVSVYGVSTENGHNYLFENDGKGGFTDVAETRGFAALSTGNYTLSSTGYGTTDEPGATSADYVGSNGFGIQCADLNNDGYLDIYLTAISHPEDGTYSRKWSDPSQVLINQGPSGKYAFKNEFIKRKLAFNEGDVDGAVVDYDNDGRLDLSVSRDKKYEGSYTDTDQKAWFGLFHQESDGTFTSVGYASGINDPNLTLYRMKNAQNHAWADIDHDGDLDLLVGGRDTGGGRPNFLFENTIGSKNAWLVVRLRGDGTKINRDAIGARLTVRLADGKTVLLREVQSSRGTYNSTDTRDLYVGLGKNNCGYTVEVKWPDGKKATYSASDVPEEHFTTIDYAKGIVKVSTK